MIASSCSPVDKKALSNAFSAAALHYDSLAHFQQRVGFALLPETSRTVKNFLDLGCGTGFFIPHLQALFPQAQALAVDIAPGMARFSGDIYKKATVLCADAHALPLQENIVDAIYSNLMFQWCDDIAQALREARRVLAPGGHLYFSLLTQHSMHELRKSWSHVSEVSRLMHFMSKEAVAPMVTQAGFSHLSVKREIYTSYYPTVRAFLMAMKLLGTKNLTLTRGRGLMTPHTLARLSNAYERFRNGEGLLPVTYEVLFIHAS